MNHSIEIDHSNMDHSNMDHSNMDYNSNTDHSGHIMDNGEVDHSQHMMGGNGTMHDMMKMYFHFSTDATILFEPWKTTNWQGMLGSCIAVFFLASLYEGLKVGRELLLRRYSTPVAYNVASADEVTFKAPSPAVSQRMLSCGHALQTTLHLLQVVLSYFLMLIFMTYNMNLCIAVALGATFGYFVFGWKRAVVVDINEHCH